METMVTMIKSLFFYKDKLINQHCMVIVGFIRQYDLQMLIRRSRGMKPTKIDTS